MKGLRLGLSLTGGSGFTFTPAEVTTAGWWDISDESTLFSDAGTTPAVIDGPIARVNDKSGNARHLSSGGTAPTYRQVGGISYAQTAAAGVLTAGFVFTQPYTRISLLRQQTYTNGYLLDGDSFNSAILWQNGSSPNLSLYAGTAGSPSSTGLAVATWGVTTEIFNGASSKLAINNDAYATGDPGPLGPNGITIGGDGDGGNRSNLYWAETVLIAGVASDADIANVRKYLGNKAGLVL